MKYEVLAQRYTGQIAEGYEAKRVGRKTWSKEQEVTERFLSRLVPGSSVIDIPVGTGRFIPFYRRFDLAATGLDISEDMLAASREKAATLNFEINLRVGDVRHIDAQDRSFDNAVCVRFVNWLDFAGMETTLAELARVTRSNIILSVRTWPTPRTLRQRVHQAWISFRRRHAELRFHNREATEALFSRLGLNIADSELVRQGRDQTQFIFYFLTKTA